jgi:hypothetical protein
VLEKIIKKSLQKAITEIRKISYICIGVIDWPLYSLFQSFNVLDLVNPPPPAEGILQEHLISHFPMVIY